jgi:hypothetical protein
MNVFTADPRDAFSGMAQGCNACCCGQATARPDETNKWMINYAAWAWPLGGRGLTDRVEFSLSKRDQSVDSRAPVNTNKRFTAEFNTEFEGDVSTGSSDPLEGTLTYALYQLNPPKFGEVELNPNGSFTYTPTLGFLGQDKFYVVTSNEAKSIINEIVIRVQDPDAPSADADIPFDKPLAVVQKSVRIDREANTLSFALQASPLAVVGDIYRMQVKQPAIDCDCQEYTHISCFDITIVNC